MKNKTWEVVCDVSSDAGKPTKYARLEYRGRMQWKTKRIAEKHAREYKARHLRDAWAQEVN